MRCPKCGSKWVQIMIENDFSGTVETVVNIGHFAWCAECNWESPTGTFAEALAALEGDGR